MLVRMLQVACLVLLCGCGSERSAPQARPRLIAEAGGTPEFLQREDLLCYGESSLPAFLSAQTVLTMPSEVGETQVAVDLSAIQRQGLAGPGIAGTYIRGTHLLRRAFRDERPVLAGHERLSICRPQGGYQRWALENASLASVYGIQTAAQAYADVAAVIGAPTLPPVHLLMLPHTIEETAVDSRQIVRKTLTDNAHWFRLAEDGRYYIAVLPHSYERRQQFRQRFWEQPAVIAHEYGHHAFAHLTAGSGAGAKPSRLRRALDEGFADLFAYYAFQMQEAPRAFSGRLLFDGSRDVETAWLQREGQRIRKQLNGRLLRLFFADDHSGYLRDEHTFGAVVAWGLNKLLYSGQSARDAMELLLRWAQKIGPSLAGGASEGHLALLLWEGVTLVRATQGNLEGEQCRNLQRNWPVFFQQWQRGQRLPECAVDGPF